MKSRARSWLLDHVSPGLASSPFEFAVSAAYGVTAVRLLSSAAMRKQAVVLLPPQAVTPWAALLLSGSLCVIVGLFTAAHRPMFGLLLERVGLWLFAVDLVTYFYAVWVRVGTQFNVALATTGATLLAVLFKALTISSAVDGARLQAKLRGRRKGTHGDAP